MAVSDGHRLKRLMFGNAKLDKVPTGQMMEVATLKEMLGKTSYARFQEECLAMGTERQRLKSAPGDVLWTG